MTPVRQLTMGLVRHSSRRLRLRRQPARCPRVCGGSCEADADNDGICDDESDELVARSMLVVCATAWSHLRLQMLRHSSRRLRLRRQPARCSDVCGGSCEADADMDGFATMWTIALVNSMLAVFLAAQVKSTPADALTFQRAIATATATARCP